ncbi:hypothetical protein BDA96_01G498900 [Sorghum bicolor]|uniref:Uncharacterized protein n=1 Tax=Sorghum bicolor TaxID=4558 RepID=A0A921V2H7_SORBI|nr:hypothetical protein BDA96_01G498900 [Sorghum bicolor]
MHPRWLHLLGRLCRQGHRQQRITFHFCFTYSYFSIPCNLIGDTIVFVNRTVIGIKHKDCIVLVAEKLVTSEMMLERSNRRIHSVHRCSGLVTPFK